MKSMKILSLALALMMVVCVFAACGKDTGEGSDEVEITYVDQYGNPIDPDSLNSKDDDSTASDGDTASTDDKTDDTGSSRPLRVLPAERPAATLLSPVRPSSKQIPIRIFRHRLRVRPLTFFFGELRKQPT